MLLTHYSDLHLQAPGWAVPIRSHAVILPVVTLLGRWDLVAAVPPQDFCRALSVPGEGDGAGARGHGAVQHQAMSFHHLSLLGPNLQGHPRDGDSCETWGGGNSPVSSVDTPNETPIFPKQ